MSIVSAQNRQSPELAMRIYRSQGARDGDSFWIRFRRVRELTWHLFQRDFRVRHRQAALGLGWSLFVPVAAVGGFVFMREAGLLNVGATRVPYPLFALTGITVWQLFAHGLSNAATALVGGSDALFKLRCPREAFVFASLGSVIFDTIVRLALVVVVLAMYGVSVGFSLLLFPLALVPILALTLGVGFTLAILNSLVRDVGKAVTFLGAALLAVTPVLYPPPAQGWLRTIMLYNPLAPLVDVPRSLLIGERPQNLFEYAMCSAVAVVVLAAGWRLFRVAEPRVAERM